MTDFTIFNLILLTIFGLFSLWTVIIYWLNQELSQRGENPRKWNTLAFFTGPVALFIYLVYFRERKPQIRCSACGKKLTPKVPLTICPHCHHQLSPEVAQNAFLNALSKFDDSKIRIVGKENITLSDLPKTADQFSPIKAVKMILDTAIKSGATDIHLEPEPDNLRIRLRIDGILHETMSPPSELRNAIIPCIKAMADIDVAEKRKPLDGRMQLDYEMRRIDVRVATSPTIFGEKVALRILDRKSYFLSLDELGFAPEIKTQFVKLIQKPQGMILVTGPTGCGKTTTLYAALSSLDVKTKNIMTIEEPVEYQLEGITQIPINPRAEITFASGLRSVLRQDPDIVMVGEIRDQETAEIAIRAALTGHLIFSTLHTNDAVGAVVRLMDIGIEPYLISAAVLAVLAQRLVRLICPHCKVVDRPNPELLVELGIPLEEPITYYKGKGCSQCNFTGYSGRTGIFELLVLDDELRQMIDRRASAVEIKQAARSRGMKTMLEDGIEKIKKGLTTVYEVAQQTTR